VSRVLDGVHGPEDVRRLPAEVLPELCAELRQEIIEVCGRVGGHLGASLGAVELIVALHRVFRSPRDRLVFDVGHQAYAHKLLTGRRSRMHTLRQECGVAPFLDPAESPHDAFGAGHACTAASVALGMLEAKVLLGEAGRAVAIIGDGALTGGLTYEALNNAATSRAPLIAVLNDNQMSISVTVGAVSRMLRGTQARAFFEAMGFTYLGPLDGHDLPALVEALEEARRSRRPIVVHAYTQKGKGLAEAEADLSTRGHAMGPYEWRAGKLVRSRGGQATFSEAFAQALDQAMQRDRRVVAVSPAMLEGSALTGLKARYPDRVFDVGIAEQHAVAFCAGLCAQGLRPVCLIYSSFLQRAFDQVVHELCLPRLPVVLAVDRAGLVGADGATHQGAYDLSFLRPLSGLMLLSPVVGEDLRPMLDAALERQGPTAIRFPRITLPERPEAVRVAGQPVAHARWLQKVSAPSLAVVALGPLALAALEAANARPRWSVLDARVLNPLDRQALLEAAEPGRVLTAEEGTVRGGLGSAVLELYAEEDRRPKVRCLGMPDTFVRHGDARAQRAALGLDAEGLRRAGDALCGGQA
jgi:1-deoxy-D-xylulose-5-phosphate synthase